MLNDYAATLGIFFFFFLFFFPLSKIIAELNSQLLTPCNHSKKEKKGKQY